MRPSRARSLALVWLLTVTARNWYSAYWLNSLARELDALDGDRVRRGKPSLRVPRPDAVLAYAMFVLLGATTLLGIAVFRFWGTAQLSEAQQIAISLGASGIISLLFAPIGWRLGTCATRLGESLPVRTKMDAVFFWLLAPLTIVIPVSWVLVQRWVNRAYLACNIDIIDERVPPSGTQRRWNPFRILPPVTLIVGTIWIGAFITASLIYGDMTTVAGVIRAGGLTPESPAQHQWWRFLVSPMIHVGTWHLIQNLLITIPLGVILERQIGTIRMAVVVVLGGLAGGAAAISFGPDASTMAGGSGITYALLGAGVAWSALNRAPRMMYLPLAAVMVGWTLIGVAAQFEESSVPSLNDSQVFQVSHSAHLGGFTAGIIVMLILAFIPSADKSSVRRSRASVRRALGIALAGAALAGVLFGGKSLLDVRTHQRKHDREVKSLNSLSKELHREGADMNRQVKHFEDQWDLEEAYVVEKDLSDAGSVKSQVNDLAVSKDLLPAKAALYTSAKELVILGSSYLGHHRADMELDNTYENISDVVYSGSNAQQIARRRLGLSTGANLGLLDAIRACGTSCYKYGPKVRSLLKASEYAYTKYADHTLEMSLALRHYDDAILKVDSSQHRTPQIFWYTDTVVPYEFSDY